MALVKSPQSHYQPSIPDSSVEMPSNQAQRPVVAAQPPRRGADFGRKPAGVSPDTYIKLRFADTPDMPETWFKLNQRNDGLMAFEPTTREHPVVLLMNKGDSTLRMYNLDNAGNFDAVGPQRNEGVLAEIQVRKRRDSTPENPQMFLVGVYFPEEGRGERELRGNLVGAYSKDIMLDMSQASYREWKARQATENVQTPAPVAAQPVEIVAGQELNFGV